MVEQQRGETRIRGRVDMAVLGVSGVTLEVPDLGVGTSFYTSAGLVADVAEGRAAFCCPGGQTPCINLVQGGAQMRLHHVTLRANALDPVRRATTRLYAR